MGLSPGGGIGAGGPLVYQSQAAREAMAKKSGFDGGKQPEVSADAGQIRPNRH